MIKEGCPWVLTWELGRSAAEDLNTRKGRRLIERLLWSGAVRTLGAAPVCSSFSRAVHPDVRSVDLPGGLPHISPAMFIKVCIGNSQNKWLARLRRIWEKLSLPFFIENPDSSFFWRMPGWEDCAPADSPRLFRCDLCHFGCPWRKRTRFATNTSLAGGRYLCKKSGHRVLRGCSVAHRKPWTLVAQTYPLGLCKVLARALCAAAAWTSARPLDPASCAKAGSGCRIAWRSLTSWPSPHQPKVPCGASRCVFAISAIALRAVPMFG